MSKNFAMTGVAGYIAPRHLKAIKETGNRLLAACDPHDSVGLLDSYFDDCKFFTEFERFDRHIEKLKRMGESERVHYVTVCSPNYLHDAHVRFALRVGADAICEKPVVLNPWNIDALQELEQESGKRVYTILQLRVHPSLVALRDKIRQERVTHKHEIVLTYITSRGAWYLVSWKGQEERSGGLATNIGIHFFDLLIWLFGDVQQSQVHHATPKRAGVQLAYAAVLLDIHILKPGPDGLETVDVPGDILPGHQTLAQQDFDHGLKEQGVGPGPELEMRSASLRSRYPGGRRRPAESRAVSSFPDDHRGPGKPWLIMGLIPQNTRKSEFAMSGLEWRLWRP